LTALTKLNCNIGYTGHGERSFACYGGPLPRPCLPPARGDGLLLGAEPALVAPLVHLHAIVRPVVRHMIDAFAIAADVAFDEAPGRGRPFGLCSRGAHRVRQKVAGCREGLGCGPYPFETVLESASGGRFAQDEDVVVLLLGPRPTGWPSWSGGPGRPPNRTSGACKARAPSYECSP
jgi:hypothetical protein